MADINALFPSKYLKSADIKGHEPTVVISHVNVEKVGEKDGQEERKPILFFQNKDKGMVLNRTNADTLSELYGNDTDDWAGRQITIFVTRVSGPNGMTDGLRLKAPLRRPAQNGGAQHVVTDKGGYKTSEIRKPDPIEEVTGHLTRDPADDEIPF